MLSEASNRKASGAQRSAGNAEGRGYPAKRDLAQGTQRASLASDIGHEDRELHEDDAYRSFGYTVGRKMARVFALTSSSQRTALAFVDAEGTVRRSDSWQQAGRVIGHVSEMQAKQAG